MTAKPAFGNLISGISLSARKKAAGLARNFSADRTGAVILLFGLTLVPILGFVGGATAAWMDQTGAS